MALEFRPEVPVPVQVVGKKPESQFKTHQPGRRVEKIDIRFPEIIVGLGQVSLEDMFRNPRIKFNPVHLFGFLPKQVASRPQAIPNIILQESGFHRVQVYQCDGFAGLFIEQDIVDFGIAVYGSNLEYSGGFPLFKHIPVIVQTAKTQPNNIVQGMDSGAYQYLTKPFEEEVLHSMVRSAIAEFERFQSVKGDAEEKVKDMRSSMFKDRIRWRTP